MLKKISKKIEQIRLEPEHVRMRYVWGSVTISMIIIFAIWIFSITSMFGGDKNTDIQNTGDTASLTEQLQNLKQQAPSLENFTDQPITVSNEGVATPTDTTDEFQYPINDTDEQVPQADAYSDLPNATPAQ